MLRLHRKAAMVALGAAIVGSIAIATPAQATVIGRAGTYNNGTWGAGWDACKYKYPRTKSVRLDDSEPTTSSRYYYWICYDTPNTT